MKTTDFLLSILLLSGATSVCAQEAAKTTIPQLIEQLGDTEYSVRQAAEKALLQRGKAALEVLKKGAVSHTDAEVRWRAARIQKQIENGQKSPPKGLKQRDKADSNADQPSPPETPPLRERQRQLRGRGFLLDQGFQDFFGPQSGFIPFDGGLRERIKKLSEGFPAIGEFSSSQRSVRVESSRNGVRVEVTEPGPDGKPQKKIYKAPDMDSFKKKYPDVLDTTPKGWPGLSLTRPGLKLLPPRATRKILRQRIGEGNPVPRSGPQLGVYIGEVDPAVARYLGLESGLMVQDVVDDSLAQSLGIQAGDIVIKVGSRPIRNVSDVGAGLQASGEGKATVEILRRGRPMTLTQSPKQAGAKTPAKK